MRHSWKAILTACSAVALLAAAPSTVAAQTCGDINGDGNFNVADLPSLADGILNGFGGGVCGTGTASDCADIVADASPVSIDAQDLAAAVDTQAGIETLFDPCTGCRTNIAKVCDDASACETDADCAGIGDNLCNDTCDTGGAITYGDFTITESTYWPAACAVTLDGTVFVETPDTGSTTVLCIEEGSTIEGTAGGSSSALIFLPEAKIDAIGTAASPIVFTSDAPDGSRGKADWSGIMFNGTGTVNQPGCKATAEGIPTAFGGCDANDSSGQAAFVRAEFAGENFTPNNELNIWTMNGVGRGTDFHHIHTNMGNDDGFEWFGSTNFMHHLVTSAIGDDNFDCQLGTTSELQFGFAIINKAEADAGRDSRGIECDNSEFDNDALPRSAPKMCNLTLIGSESETGSANDGSDSGVLLRRGATGQFANLIVADFGDAGFEFRDTATSREACVDDNADNVPDSATGNTIIRNSAFLSNGSGGTEQAKSGGTLVGPCGGGDPDCHCTSPAFYGLMNAGFSVAPADGTDSIVSTAGGACVAGVCDPDLPVFGDGIYPAEGDLYDTTYNQANFEAAGAPSAFDCSELSPNFESTTYIGAFDPGAACTTSGGASDACDWLVEPWIAFNVD